MKDPPRKLTASQAKDVFEGAKDGCRPHNGTPSCTVKLGGETVYRPHKEAAKDSACKDGGKVYQLDGYRGYGQIKNKSMTKMDKFRAENMDQRMRDVADPSKKVLREAARNEGCTVVHDKKATKADMKAAYGDKNTVAIFHDGHGTEPKGKDKGGRPTTYDDKRLNVKDISVPADSKIKHVERDICFGGNQADDLKKKLPPGATVGGPNRTTPVKEGMEKNKFTHPGMLRQRIRG